MFSSGQCTGLNPARPSAPDLNFGIKLLKVNNLARYVMFVIKALYIIAGHEDLIRKKFTGGS